jgi:hypothetical protein
MIKLKTTILVTALAAVMSSCLVATRHYTTGNPIGTKEGYVKGSIAGNSDAGIATAAKLGQITKIGSVDIYYYASGKVAIRVSGE